MLTAASAPPTAPPDFLGSSSPTKGTRKASPSPATPKPPTTPSAAPGGGPEESKPASGRANGGRFSKGNPGGPGNPYARRTAALRHALLDIVTEDEIRAVAAELLELAKEGDVPAARLVLSYTIGKPTPAVDPDKLDVQEWDLFRQEVGNDDDLNGVVNSLPVSMLCDIARAMVPLLREQMTGEVVQALRAPPADSVDDADEEVLMAQPRIPVPEEVLPPRPKKPRARTDPTTTADASPAVPLVPPGSGTETSRIAEVATQCAAAAPRGPSLRGTSEAVAEYTDNSNRAPTLPPSPSTGSVARPRTEEGRKDTPGGAVASAACAAREQPRPCVESVQKEPAERGGSANGTPALEDWLQRRLRQLGLGASGSPLANGDNRRTGRTEGDNGAQNGRRPDRCAPAERSDQG